MKVALAYGAMLVLGGCVSTPLAPDPTIDARGDYRVVAVNGESTGGGERYNFTITPPTGSARFGCNAGSGSLAVERGYLVTGDWIITAAGCPGRPLAHLERIGFRITSQPMAIELRAGGIRLRNRLGSIDLVRPPPPVVIGRWRAVAIDGAPLGERDGLVVTLDTNQLRANACNELAGGYRLDGRRMVRVGPWRETEKECYDPTGQYDPMAFEKRVFAILSGPLKASNPTPETLRLQGPDSRIDFVQIPPVPPIAGRWTAVALDGVAARSTERFSLTLTENSVHTDGLCNDMPGHRYRIANGRIMPDGPPWPKSEKGCAPAEMQLESRAWAVIGRMPTVMLSRIDRMRLESTAGSIDFERKR